MMAWGVDGGTVHIDYYQILQYNIDNGSFKKVATTENEIIGISYDDKYLITQYSNSNESGLEIFDVSDINNVNSRKIAIESFSSPAKSQISKNTNEIIVAWRGGGISIVNLMTGQITEKLLQEDMTTEYKGLGYGINATQGNYFYFNVASNYYTNGYTDFMLYKYNLSDNTYDSLALFEEDLYFSTFLYVEEE